jgi:hypothetical protein
MRTIRLVEIAAIASALTAGIFLFVHAWLLSDLIPTEYRSASPGFNWGWEYDYEGAMRNTGKFGGKPWPWPAQKTGSRIILPLDQPLVTDGLEITYQGGAGALDFSLNVVIQNLDTDVAYPHEFLISEARKGFSIDDKQFVLEQITPLYLRLSLLQTD